MPFRIGPLELVVVLVLALLIFGPGRIAKIGGELGKGIHAFQEGLKGEQKKTSEEKNGTEDATL